MRQQRLGAAQEHPGKQQRRCLLQQDRNTDTWSFMKLPLQKGLQEALANTSEISDAALG